MSDEDQCGSVRNEDSLLNLRIASVFIILVTSAFGACFPLWAKDRTIVPRAVFQYVCPPPSFDPSLTRHLPVALSLDLRNILAQVSSYVADPAFSLIQPLNSVLQIATAFIHLLSPGFEALGSPCLSGAWSDYVKKFCLYSAPVLTLALPIFVALALRHFNGRRLLPLLC